MIIWVRLGVTSPYFIPHLIFSDQTCVETDLHAVVRANILEEVHKQYIIYQLLKALKFLHTGDLLHRDIKPSNLLLNSDCHVKTCDFGLCRSVAESTVTNNPVLTDYVATRWYRAPEILLGSTKYTKAVDMWSVGCILGEMLSGKPVFPGTSTMNQLDRVIEVTGRPSKEDIDAIKSPFAATMLESLPPTKAKSLKELFPTASNEAIDLINQCLQFNPSKRITVLDALKHPYVASFHNESDEPASPEPIRINIDDNTKYTAADYRDRLYKEMAAMKKGKSASVGTRKDSTGSTTAGSPAPSSTTTTTVSSSPSPAPAPTTASAPSTTAPTASKPVSK